MFPIPQNINSSIYFQNDDIVVIDDFYSKDDSNYCIDLIDKLPFLTYYKMKYRGIIDDKQLSSTIFNLLQQYCMINDWNAVSINHKWRYIKGDKGYFMTMHFDEHKFNSINEKTFYTVLLYLNDDDGGDIVFDDYKIGFKPKAGRLILFNQKLLHHSLPSNNQKYFLHSEVFFMRNKIIDNITDINAFQKFKIAQDLSCYEKEKELEIAFMMSSELEKMVLDL